MFAPVRYRAGELCFTAVAFVFFQALVSALVVPGTVDDAPITPPATVHRASLLDFGVKLSAASGFGPSVHGTPLDRFYLGAPPRSEIRAAILQVSLLANTHWVAVLAVVFLAAGGATPRKRLLGATLAVGLSVHAFAFALASPTTAALYFSADSENAHALHAHAVGVLLLSIALSATAAAAPWRGRVAILVLLLAALGGVALEDPDSEPEHTDIRKAARSNDGGPKRELGHRIAHGVILVSIDSLRADRLQPYGHHSRTSPHIAALAANGTLFTNAMTTAPWTLPSHMSMFTGHYPLRHGVNTEFDRLANRDSSITRLLQDSGIRTHAIVAEDILLAPERGFGAGFDEYDTESYQRAANPEQSAAEVIAGAEQWLVEHGGNPFFLFLHLWDVHYDYDAPDPYSTIFDPDYSGAITTEGFIDDARIHADMPSRDLDHVWARYDGEIRWVDSQIGHLIATLQELGIAKSTAVLITSDHGDEFFEHGGKGHGLTLYRELMNVPLILQGPGVPPGGIVETPVSLVDIAPTVLELMGATASRPMDGTSLLPLVHRPADRFVYGLRCPSCLVMQHSNAGTLIYSFHRHELEYYSSSDTRQQRNLAGTRDGPSRRQLEALVAFLNQQWRAHRNDIGGRRELAVDEATRERLRALGYRD